ncbi:MAG: UDP-N-acetylenolpyruvoylglucosamine reductase, partial [Bacteroidales bacterium]|nr:UDP-N-acetylenolpyruvoylglucosamine reductase [Bacteroidales bacterium]
SFFKNPVVKIEKAEELKNLYPSLKIYPAGEGMCKLPAAWLIDQCGFKGKRFGNVGVHEKQPLVLLAYKGAVAAELLELSSLIIREVRGKFGIEISPEVNIF